MEQVVVQKAFDKHFKKFYTSTRPSQDVIQSCFQNLESCVSKEMNGILKKTFTRKEVENAIVIEKLVLGTSGLD